MSSNDPQESGSGNLPRGLLGRMGTPVGKDTRLASLRGPRDLTLGGVKKKTFQPKIPARREKKNEEFVEQCPSTSRSQFESRRGRGRGDVRGLGRGRGRGRGFENVIQSRSIFEEGPSASTKVKTSTDYEERGYSSGLRTSAIKREKEMTAEESKHALEFLLRDDFVVNEKLETEDPNLVPVCLPITAKIKDEVKPEAKNTVKVKEEPMDDILIDDSSSTGTIPGRPTVDLSAAKPKTTAELFAKACQSGENELMFIQLPDTLPGEPTIDEDPSVAKPKQKKHENITKKMHSCKLSDFHEGYIGRLRIHKSGRTSLQLGNTVLDVCIGTPPGFLQDLVSIRTAEEDGDLAVLGHVQHKILCLPRFESMVSDR